MKRKDVISQAIDQARAAGSEISWSAPTDNCSNAFTDALGPLNDAAYELIHNKEVKRLVPEAGALATRLREVAEWIDQTALPQVSEGHTAWMDEDAGPGEAS